MILPFAHFFSRRSRRTYTALALIAFFIGSVSAAVKNPVSDATPENSSSGHDWAQSHLLDPHAKLPFSFVYGDQPSETLMAGWSKKLTSKKDQAGTHHELSWSDAKTGLEVRCVTIEYADYPAVEWTVYFKNTGGQDTAILRDIQGIDANFQRPAGGEFLLHGNKGDWCLADSYEPFATPLLPGTQKRFASVGGRPTNHAFPFYNLQIPGGGIFLAIGWPGQWASSFTRDGTDNLRVVAGQQFTSLLLKPGEQVRSPLIALLFWKGRDQVAAQNQWRHWMIDHNLPRTVGGAVPPPQLNACSSHQFNEMTQADEPSQKLFIDRYLEKGIKLDYWWMDAGWYPCDGKWQNTGTWEPDATRFPHGLRPVSDHAHAKGVKIITWFEPERVGDPNSWLGKNHPEWLLGNLLNLGNPAALDWVINHVDRTLTEQGIDYYRQDFNLDPLIAWQNADQPDRQGLTENLYVQGYLAYWDALRARHPGMLIDSCASGGRRNDLETLRRSVPLLRSDYIFEPIGQQSHSYGLSSWVPFYGTGTAKDAFDAYHFRSTMCPGMILCYDVRTDRKEDFARVANFINQWRDVSPAMLGDYYPLTPYSLAHSSWIAWQFDLPKEGKGFVQAFRRDQNDESASVYWLSGIDPAAQYEVTDVDTATPVKISGRELAENGLRVTINEKPGTAVIRYQRLK